METNYSLEIGQRIKAFRKSAHIAHITLAELSEKINKSTATISKYENGSITLDINTLYEIADALNIGIWQLVRIPQVSEYSLNREIAEDNKIYTLYLYTLDRHSSDIIHSCIEMFKEGSEYKVTLYWNLTSHSDYDCEMIYHGHCHSHSATMTFSLANQWNPMDELFVNLTKPLGNYTYMTGLLTGYAINPIYPISQKAIVSYRLMRNMETVKELLTINRDERKNVRNKNLLLLRGE